MSESSVGLLREARAALGITQNALAARLGVANRTGQRWNAGHTAPTDSQLAELARLVHPVNAALAPRIATHARTTPDALGLPSRPAHERAPAAAAHLVDSVVCAAADAAELPPRAIRRALLAAVVRTRELRLGLETLESVLSRPHQDGRRAAPPGDAPLRDG